MLPEQIPFTRTSWGKWEIGPLPYLSNLHGPFIRRKETTSTGTTPTTQTPTNMDLSVEFESPNYNS